MMDGVDKDFIETLEKNYSMQEISDLLRICWGFLLHSVQRFCQDIDLPSRETIDSELENIGRQAVEKV